MRTMPIALLTVLGVCVTLSVPPTPSRAAEWLAPAADEQITADWVKDVAKAFKSNRFKNVFMNQPFGCDQCQILGFLNDAADALDYDQPKMAKSFIRRAIDVLEEGREQHWYSESDIRPIKRLIIKKANKALQEAGASQLTLAPPRDRGQDPRYETGDDPLFSRSEDRDSAYGSRKDRWSGYTSNRRLGLSNERSQRGHDRGNQTRNQGQDGRYDGGGALFDPSEEARAYGAERWTDSYGRHQGNAGNDYRGRYEESDPFSDDYADQLAWDQPSRSSHRREQGRQDSHNRKDGMRSKDAAGPHDMSREEFRRLNQRHYDDRFAAVEDLKESANQNFDHNRFRGPRGPIRQPGD